MADCVSVMAFTLVGDEKRRLGERRISAMGRFLLLSLKERPSVPDLLRSNV